MSYIIQTPLATFRTLRDAQDTTKLSRQQIIGLCQTAGSGWSMCRVGGTRIDADRYQKQRTQREWLTTAQPPSVAVEPTPVVTPPVDPMADLVAELRELRGELASLRKEVVELTAQAQNVLTLPAGTQLNLPFCYEH